MKTLLLLLVIAASIWTGIALDRAAVGDLEERDPDG